MPPRVNHTARLGAAAATAAASAPIGSSDTAVRAAIAVAVAAAPQPQWNNHQANAARTVALADVINTTLAWVTRMRAAVILTRLVPFPTRTESC